jgi:hypothetical protein
MRKKKDTYGLPTYSKNNYNQSRSKSTHSILHKHTRFLNEFSNKKDKLKTIKTKINNTQLEISKLTVKLSKNSNNNNAKIKNDINDYNTKLLKLENEKQLIESGEDEIQYLLESSNIINEYLILEEREHQLLNLKNLSEDNNIELNKTSERKNELINLYLTKFEPGYYKLNYKREKPICPNCFIEFNVNNSFLVCPECGVCKQTVEQANELSYKEQQELDYRPQFTYDKMTHLEDWLRRFQAKENRSIPQEILDKVILEANKERIQDLNTLTEDKIKKYLKRLNLNDYYDNVIGIINRINGRPPFTLTSEVEIKIKLMFQQIQIPYEKFKPTSRKNFLSYSYTLHKFFQILGLHEFAKYFPLLKSTDKLRQQDDIFKKIVKHMSEIDKTIKWVFYPSI